MGNEARVADRTGRTGRLRVYLGAAPGVGKTYAMLTEGRRLKRDGRDVVVGYVEDHGRAETGEQIGDLEVIPRRLVAYRGVAVEEMDTDAILRRNPEIALVDELAHTNAPGSPREKRWEDVEILRRAGIDVITTVNVQHLEGLNDVVESITGIAVRETLPDRMLEGATEVQLIDLPVPALIERLAQGKIYPPHRARQAMDHFFREGNLTALRELALRRTAAGVDEALTGYMHDHEIEEVWPAAERIVVLIDHRLSAGTVLRNAWRLAGALRGELLVVACVPPGGVAALAPERREGLDRNLRLAEDLGAEVRVVETNEVAPAIASLVKGENASLVVIGHRREGRWRRLFSESLADRLIHLLENVDVHLVETND
jgi:two-component system sensor histidine kinase KdpD